MKMKYYLAAIACSIIGVSSRPAHATYIDFSSSNDISITRLNGFNFSGGYGDAGWFNGQKNPLANMAPPNSFSGGYAWIDGGNDISMSISTDVFELSSVAIYAAYATPVIINGYLDGVHKYVSQIAFDYSSPISYTALSLGWSGINSVVFSTNRSAELFISALNVNDNVSVPGPIAGASLPALLGLLGFGLYRRRNGAAKI